MTGIELKQARQSLGLTLDQLGAMVGLAPSDHRRGAVSKMETGKKPISDARRRLVDAYLAGYRPPDWPQ